MRGEDAVHDVGIGGDEGAGGREVPGLEDDEAPDRRAALEQRAGEAHAPGSRERAQVLEVGGPVPLAELRRARSVATDQGEEGHRADSIGGKTPPTRRGAGFTRRGGSVKLSG